MARSALALIASIIVNVGVETLGTQLSRGKRLAPAKPVHDHLELRKPIAWVHCPKCGSSFANALIHSPGVCPNLPEDVSVPAEPNPLSTFFREDYPKDEYCPGGFTPFHIYRAPPGHESVGDVYEQVKGNAVMMLRQPEQRILSVLHHRRMGLKPHLKWKGHSTRRDELNNTEFAEIESGCMVKMLTRANHYREGELGTSLQGPCFDIGTHEPPTEDEVDMAVTRLREGFQFVGLTDQWDLSICLFVKMFGGKCQKSMFGEVRRKNGLSTEYDPADLDGWVDQRDGPLYAEAQRIFNANLKKYDVSESNCPSSCM